MTIQTRVGQIIDGDNRFLGRSAFEDWSHRLTAPSDGLMAALGVPELSANSREVFRLLALCLTSPDARVWPLKLTRLLSSHGDPLAGYFGAQLVSAGRVMGPGAATHAARGLVFVGEQVDTYGDTDSAVAVAVARWRAQAGGRFAGFGVPFRAEDERRVGLLRLVEGGPLTQGRYWRLHLRVVAAMAPLPPNCVIALTALLLDVGVRPERCGMAFSVCMAHMYLAHALESAEQDGARLHSLPAEAVDHQGIPARRLSEPGPAARVHAALQRHLRVSPGGTPPC